MKYFIDTEFLEGTQKSWLKNSKPTIDLISIGIVSEDNREYYAISKDFNVKEAWNRFDLKPDINNGGMKKVYWIRENVLKSIWEELMDSEYNKTSQYGNHHPVWDKEDFTYRNLKKLIKKYGKTSKEIANEVVKFTVGGAFDIHRLATEPDPEFYGYYSDYDWVVFCWLFGKMINLPKNFPMYCNDLKQELDRKTQNLITSNMIKASCFEKAVNIVKNFPAYPKQTDEHNALSDAKWNYELYKFLKSL